MLAAAAVAVYAFTASRGDAAAAKRSVVVENARNATLHRTILVDRRGRSLYSLSAEKHGRFICKNAFCLSLWTPLVVPRGTVPAGAPALATIKRPDGRIQVSYRGLPLYTFKQDSKRGDVKGNGFKDVGTWLVTSAGKAAATPAPMPPSGGGYGNYGG
jgi:predicted lipoprotein with Yx(FWY)xxD motif